MKVSLGSNSNQRPDLQIRSEQKQQMECRNGSHPAASPSCPWQHTKTIGIGFLKWNCAMQKELANYLDAVTVFHLKPTLNQEHSRWLDATSSASMVSRITLWPRSAPSSNARSKSNTHAQKQKFTQHTRNDDTSSGGWNLTRGDKTRYRWPLLPRIFDKINI